MQLGNVFTDRLIQLETPLVVERQQRSARHQLGQRENLVEAVGRQRLALLAVGKPVLATLYHLTVLVDQRCNARDSPLLDFLGHRRTKGIQTLLGERLGRAVSPTARDEAAGEQHPAQQGTYP